MTTLSAAALNRRLERREFTDLFVEELGWDRLRGAAEERLQIDGAAVRLEGLAQKRDVPVYLHRGLPDRDRRRRIERELSRRQLEHLLVFLDDATGAQVWQWVKREADRPDRVREHAWRPGQAVEALRQKLAALTFTLEEESDPNRITVNTVTGRLKRAFDADRVTRRFYTEFKARHDALMAFLKGLPEEQRSWYASVTLNRLMFVWFIQKKGFVAGDPDYLITKLVESRKRGKDQFFREILGPLFFRGFACPKDERSDADKALLGDVPYLNGGLFQEHQIEREHGAAIMLPDKAFADLFDFFGGWTWHLDERDAGGERRGTQAGEINPDVLGYIFEKYVNQKQMGAYYTKEDVTEYICANTLLPRLLDKVKALVPVAFRGEGSVWRLLADNPDRYIWPSVRHGLDKTLPETIAAGVVDVATRKGVWDRPAAADLGLPTETWREVVHRRQRCEAMRAELAAGEIATPDAIVTANLDIHRFVRDAIAAASEDQLKSWWEALTSLTVLDPACGSGAFLFAALNLLEPLYIQLFDAMGTAVADAELAAAHGGTPLSKKASLDAFRQILTEANDHANPAYYVLRQIALNNLYGVDIMEEAAEICKLRLFLKLVAQLEDASQIEPLPDLDFNIRSGNSLVGFASRAQLDAAIGGELDFDRTADGIEEEAEQAALCFRRFKDSQVAANFDAAALRQTKAELERRLEQVAERANRWLATRYGSGPEKPAAYARWLVSHNPFNWFTEFYDVMHGGGFDAVVGNPPYVENEKVSYLDSGFVSLLPTAEGGNLYAPFIERSFQLTGTTARVGVIVPLSLISVKSFASVRRLAISKSSATWFSHHSIFPAKLFSGVAQRTTILLSSRGDGPAILRTTGYQKWFEDGRPQLMAVTEFVTLKPEHTSAPHGDLLPKLATELDSSILAKISRHAPLLPRVSGKAHTLLYHRSPNNWIRAHSSKPFYRGPRGEDVSKDGIRSIGFSSPETRNAYVGVIMSTAFFWWWETWGNCRHVNDTDMGSFPLSPSASSIAKLARMAQSLEADMKRHARRYERNQKATGLVVYDQFYVRKSKAIIDQIDEEIGAIYGLSVEETDHLKSFAAKFRSQGDEDEAEAA